MLGHLWISLRKNSFKPFAANTFCREAAPEPIDGLVVLAKAIASCGFCSRRDAAELIKQARVLVNGRPADVHTRVDGPLLSPHSNERCMDPNFCP